MNDRIPVKGRPLSLQFWDYRPSAHCRFCSVSWWCICSTSKRDRSLWAQLMNEMVIVNVLVIIDWKVKFTLEDILCWWQSLYHVCLDYTVSLWAFLSLLKTRSGVQNVTIYHLIIKYMYSVSESQHANTTILINLDEKNFHDVACSCITSFFFCSLEICKKYEVNLRMQLLLFTCSFFFVQPCLVSLDYFSFLLSDWVDWKRICQRTESSPRRIWGLLYLIFFSVIMIIIMIYWCTMTVIFAFILLKSK